MVGLVALVVLVGLTSWYLYEKSQRKTFSVPPGFRSEVELPHQDEWELYHNALSLCSKKSRLCMAELGLPYRSHHIDLVETGSYETLSRRFLAVNPGGTVPVLVHNGHPIYESHEQIRYAAEHAPTGSTKLVPDDPAMAAEMEEWVQRSSLFGDDPIALADESAGNAAPGLTVPLFAAMMEEIPWSAPLEGLLFHRFKQRPMMFLAFKRSGMAKLPGVGPVVGAVQKSLAAMHRHLDGLESQLEKTGGPWILGETYSLADVSWTVIFDRLREADSIHAFIGEGKRPAVTAYWDRVRARPSYREAIEAHDHPIVARGTERIRAAKKSDPELRRMLEEELQR
jgi:glutathione S-transferase